MKMPRIQQPLPEYGYLIRWPVQQVINWLNANKLDDCIKCFREAGIDGNKLVNSTKSDLQNVRCPNRLITVILDQVDKVPGRPNANRGGFPMQSRNHQQLVSTNTSDDEEGWGTDEFDDDDSDGDPANNFVAPANNFVAPANKFVAPANNFVEPTPAAPPRPNRKPNAPRALPAAPAVCSNHTEPDDEELYASADDDVIETHAPAPPRGRPPMPIPAAPTVPVNEEDYEKAVKVKPYHGGPLPQLPMDTSRPSLPKSKSKAPPIGQRVLPSLPTPAEPEELYEDPEVEMGLSVAAPVQAPHSRAPPSRPTRVPAPPSTQMAEEPEDDYEEPSTDIPVLPPSRPKHKTLLAQDHSRVPAANNNIPKLPTRPAKRAPSPLTDEDYEEPCTVTEPFHAYNSPQHLQHEEQYEDCDTTKENSHVYEISHNQDSKTSQSVKEKKPAVSPRMSRRPPPTLPGQQDRPSHDVVDNGAEPVPSETAPPPPPMPSRPARAPTEIPSRRPAPADVPPPQTTQNTSPAPAPIGGNDLETQMLSQRWYHGTISRVEAKAKLAQHKTNGMYLIRKSTSQPYTLQIYYNGGDYNLPVRINENNQYTVGNSEKTFSSLTEMINVFKQSTLILNQLANTKLVCSLPKT